MKTLKSVEGNSCHKDVELATCATVVMEVSIGWIEIPFIKRINTAQIKTKSTGVATPKPVYPKLSSCAFISPLTDAEPMPKLIIKGTVRGPVIAPPASRAMEKQSSAAKGARRKTIAYTTKIISLNGTWKMERIRERVKYGKSYLYINEKCKVVEVYDNTDFIDDSNWEVGNYYLPSERAQAEEDAKAVKAIFEKRLKV